MKRLLLFILGQLMFLGALIYLLTLAIGALEQAHKVQKDDFSLLPKLFTILFVAYVLSVLYSRFKRRMLAPPKDKDVSNG